MYQYYKNRDACWNQPDSTNVLGQTPREQSLYNIAHQSEYNRLLSEGEFDLSKSFSDPEMAKNYVAMTEDGEFTYTPKYIGGTGPMIGPGGPLKGLRFLKGKKGMDFFRSLFW